MTNDDMKFPKEIFLVWDGNSDSDEPAFVETKTFMTQGYGGRERLLFSPYIHQCGSIEDGVSFVHNHDGSWVIRFSDLEEMYQMARRVRGIK